MSILATRKLNIPPVPENLILSLEDIRKLKEVDIYTVDGTIIHIDSYKVYKANDDLFEWVTQNFKYEVEWVEYLVASKTLKIHSDNGRTASFNYLVQLGGDNVTTEFYESDRTTVIASNVYQLHEWWFLNVGLPHRVIGRYTEPRIIISVTPKFGVTYRPEDFM
jgi:hypothetical protein